MFADWATKPYLRARRGRRGWGRVVVLAATLLLLSSRLAYGAAGGADSRVVVGNGDTLWSIALAHYQGDPRPHVDAIMSLNHLHSPELRPGQSLVLPPG